MSDSYRHVSQGADADNKGWMIGTSGPDVVIAFNEGTTYLRFSGTERDHFAKTWAEAERRAEQAAG